MLETFKAQLKAKAKTLGVTNLQNKRIDAYAATLEKQNPNLVTDDDHAEKVNAFLEIVDIKEIAAYDDYKATKKKDGKDDKKDTKENTDDGKTSGTETSKETTQGGEEVPAWAKQILESNKTLSEKLEKLEKEKTTLSILDSIKGHEKMKDIPYEFYEDYVKPEKPEDVEAFVEKVSTKFGTFKQVDKNNKAASQTKPVSSATDTKGKADEKEVDAILDNLMPGTKAPATAK